MRSLLAPALSICSGLIKTYLSFLRRPTGERGRMRDWEFSTQGRLNGSNIAIQLPPPDMTLPRCPQQYNDPISLWSETTQTVFLDCFQSWSRGREIAGLMVEIGAASSRSCTNHEISSGVGGEYLLRRCGSTSLRSIFFQCDRQPVRRGAYCYSPMCIISRKPAACQSPEENLRLVVLA